MKKEELEIVKGLSEKAKETLDIISDYYAYLFECECGEYEDAYLTIATPHNYQNVYMCGDYENDETNIILATNIAVMEEEIELDENQVNQLAQATRLLNQNELECVITIFDGEEEFAKWICKNGDLYETPHSDSFWEDFFFTKLDVKNYK